jgi:SAM-dependent methyltransferase
MSSLQDLILSLVDAGSREHYEDAALYDYEYRRRRVDVMFYRELARRLPPDAPILDLGAGSGRLALPLARDGHPVVALDQSPAMLERLRQRIQRAPAAVASRIDPQMGDLRTFELGRRFGLTVAAFNVVEHLYTRVEVAAFLARVAEHLEPDGLLAFDVQLPDPRWLSRDPERRWARTRFTHPTTGKQIVYSTNHDYDPVTQIALIRIYYEPVDGGPTRVVKLSQRKFFPAELEALLATSGFRLVERYGDFGGAELDGAAVSQVLVCKLASSFPAPKRMPKRPIAQAAHRSEERSAVDSQRTEGSRRARNPPVSKKKLAPVEKKTKPRRGDAKSTSKRPRSGGKQR